MRALQEGKNALMGRVLGHAPKKYNWENSTSKEIR
jgi:hypothetical protein